MFSFLTPFRKSGHLATRAAARSPGHRSWPRALAPLHCSHVFCSQLTHWPPPSLVILMMRVDQLIRCCKASNLATDKCTKCSIPVDMRGWCSPNSAPSDSCSDAWERSPRKLYVNSGQYWLLCKVFGFKTLSGISVNFGHFSQIWPQTLHWCY